MTQQINKMTNNPEEDEKSLDRRIYLLGTSRFIRALGRTSSFLFLPIVLFQIYKLNLFEIGLYSGFATLIMALVQYYSGILTDRIGRRKFLIYIPIPVAVLYLLLGMGVIYKVHVIYIITIWYSTIFFNALQFPAIQATIADITKMSERLTAYTIVRLLVNTGAAVGPIIGAFLGSINLGYIFIITSILSVVELLVLLFVKETHQKKSKLTVRGINKIIIKERFLLLFTIVGILFNFLLRQRGTTFTIYIYGFKGISIFELGIIYSLNGLLVVLFQYPIFRLIASRFTYLHWRAVGSLIYAASYFMIAYLEGFIGYMFIMGMLTIGEDFVSPTTETIITSVAKEETRGSFIGFYNMATSMGNFLGSVFGLWILGLFINVPDIFWFSMAILMALVGFGYFALTIPYRQYLNSDALK
jgi:Major Facilitator Superfamily.